MLLVLGIRQMPSSHTVANWLRGGQDWHYGIGTAYRGAALSRAWRPPACLRRGTRRCINLFEWFKYDCLLQKDRPLRLPIIVRRGMPVAAWVTRHAHTLPLHWGIAQGGRAACGASLRSIRRAFTHVLIPPVEPTTAPLM